MTDHANTPRPRRQHPGGGGNGFVMLTMLVAVIGIDIMAMLASVVAPKMIVIVIGSTLLSLVIMLGFYKIQRDEAAATTLFNDRGSDRSPGLRWTWPWMAKEKRSLRTQNLISQPIEVN